jgi:tetrahydromethanopterin S-methyltransferase subunit B
MRHLLLLSSFIFFVVNTGLAQDLTSKNHTDSLMIKVNELNKKFGELQESVQSTNRTLRSLRSDYSSFVKNQGIVIDSIHDRINHLGSATERDVRSIDQKLIESSERSDTGISELKNSLSKNTIYWIIATSLAALLAIFLFVLLRRAIKSNEKNTFQQLNNTRKALEEESLRLDNKLIELLEKQLTAKEVIQQAEVTEEKDHSLALKVADEIVRIQKNLSMMDDETKGKKQLAASVERIRVNFEANGYEIVDMLNKQYHEGMKVQANFRPDESLESGQQIITRIIKPQINFNGVMIQSAQIEVSQGQ